MNSRLKAFGFGKRKSTASIQNQDIPQSHTPPPPSSAGPPQIPPQFPTRPGPTPSLSSPTSTQSLQMNHPGAGPRPPSYTANYPPGPPPPVGRTSPLINQGPARTPPTQMVGGPPPINTGAPVAGYPPPGPMGGPPPPAMAGRPPGYGGAPGYPPAGGPPPPGGGPLPPANAFNRPAAEVEGNSRSKAQLIVGIDFVS